MSSMSNDDGLVVSNRCYRRPVTIQDGSVGSSAFCLHVVARAHQSIRVFREAFNLVARYVRVKIHANPISPVQMGAMVNTPYCSRRACAKFGSHFKVTFSIPPIDRIANIYPITL
jgi:hypothetical protein